MECKQFSAHGALAAELADAVAARLAEAIAQRGAASIALSGGSTPVMFLDALSKMALDWPSVHVTLVDERCVPPDHPRSNARLVHEHLLDRLDRQPAFYPLHVPGEDEGARSARFARLPWPLDCVILGMGNDGHTASFFPGAANLSALLDPSLPEKILHTRSVPDDEPRVTWTLAALLEARATVLHICGRDKWQVLAAARDQLALKACPEHAHILPIAVLLEYTSQVHPGGVPLDIYFAETC